MSTFDDLRGNLASFMERDDFTDADYQLSIRMMESDVNARLRTREMVKRVTLQSQDGVLTLPDDFNVVRFIKPHNSPLGNLQYTPLEHLERTERVLGQPYAYALEGQTVRLWPEPKDPSQFTLVYYAKLPALSATNQSNWLIHEHPQVYLYGVATHLYGVFDDPREAKAQARFETALTHIIRDSIDGQYGADVRPAPRSAP